MTKETIKENSIDRLVLTLLYGEIKTVLHTCMRQLIHTFMILGQPRSIGLTAWPKAEGGSTLVCVQEIIHTVHCRVLAGQFKPHLFARLGFRTWATPRSKHQHT
ncbi:hypothetical protein RRG08_037274 [Elysia crispata]|uniref:Uncharacterized protein n=1 Tax=Elysia crispata TaxID=231223 RepID=A0AAE1CP20_9GAST|nr:hypothetical protein RRG08_037274 [Elysia crispata]